MFAHFCGQAGQGKEWSSKPDPMRLQGWSVVASLSNPSATGGGFKPILASKDALHSRVSAISFQPPCGTCCTVSENLPTKVQSTTLISFSNFGHREGCASGLAVHAKQFQTSKALPCWFSAMVAISVGAMASRVYRGTRASQRVVRCESLQLRGNSQWIQCQSSRTSAYIHQTSNFAKQFGRSIP